MRFILLILTVWLVLPGLASAQTAADCPTPQFGLGFFRVFQFPTGGDRLEKGKTYTICFNKSRLKNHSSFNRYVSLRLKGSLTGVVDREITHNLREEFFRWEVPKTIPAGTYQIGVKTSGGFGSTEYSDFFNIIESRVVPPPPAPATTVRPITSTAASPAPASSGSSGYYYVNPVAAAMRAAQAGVPFTSSSPAPSPIPTPEPIASTATLALQNQNTNQNVSAETTPAPVRSTVDPYSVDPILVAPWAKIHLPKEFQYIVKGTEYMIALERQTARDPITLKLVNAETNQPFETIASEVEFPQETVRWEIPNDSLLVRGKYYISILAGKEIGRSGVFNIIDRGTFQNPASASTGFSYTWNNNLSYGLNNNEDVRALQQILTLEGVFSGPINGRFGPQTRAAVIAFQKKYGFTSVPRSGFVGPYTRQVLNRIYSGPNITLIGN